MRTEVLDHGYVELVESWGSDERIIEAARMSTGKGFLGWGPNPCTCTDGTIIVELKQGWLGDGKGDPDTKRVACPRCSGTQEVSGDEKLLAFLWQNSHATPFEMGGLVIEVQAPIMVYREWHRHRTQSYNELSARYTPLPDVNYVPTVERLLLNSKTNKQAGTVAGADELTADKAEWFRSAIAYQYGKQQSLYETALASGVPKELARVHLPVGRYSRMRASANLRNWLGFLTLRMAPNAQWEIRQYANAVGEIVAAKFPRTWALFRGN